MSCDPQVTPTISRGKAKEQEINYASDESKSDGWKLVVDIDNVPFYF